jgi:hypothetical protein
LMAPRVDRTVDRFPPPGGERRRRKASETDRDLARHRTRSDIWKRTSCHSSRVKGAAAGGDRNVVRDDRHSSGGRLAQLVRALP